MIPSPGKRRHEKYLRHRILWAGLGITRTSCRKPWQRSFYYSDVIMGAMASQITCLTIVYSAVYSGADSRKHQSSASLAFVGGINRWAVNSPHKWPVTRKMFPFDDVIKLKRKLLLHWQKSHLYIISLYQYTPFNAIIKKSLLQQWRHIEHYDVSNHQHLDCVQQIVHAHNKGNIKCFKHHWPFVRESTGDRWIPLINGQ